MTVHNYIMDVHAMTDHLLHSVIIPRIQNLTKEGPKGATMKEINELLFTI